MINIRRINKRYQGFTLLESLLVLLVVCFMIGLPTVLMKQTKEVVSVSQFFAQFEKYLLYTQQMAVVGETDTMVSFSETEQLFYFSSTEKKRLQVPAVLLSNGPEKIIFKKGTGNNGNLSKYRFEWQNRGESIEFQFQMGNGRYVKKIGRL